MDVRGMGYLVLESTEAELWPSFAEDVLDLSVVVDPNGVVVLRADERAARMVIVPGERDRLLGTGLELAGRAAWAAACADLEAVGHEVVPASVPEAARRRVTDFATVQDPSGNVIELFYGPLLHAAPRRSIVTYRTGSLGLGHVVLPAPELDITLDFYVGTLGFRHRDTIKPSLGGHDPVTLHFLGCNGRHHTVALSGASDPRGMRHFMLEVESIADMGRVYDRCVEKQALMTQLGQHSNDQGLSFYINCPGGAVLEYGTSCIVVDDSTWSAREVDDAGFWGHQLVRG